jgi:hypothetical protein
MRSFAARCRSGVKNRATEIPTAVQRLRRFHDRDLQNYRAAARLA